MINHGNHGKFNLNIGIFFTIEFEGPIDLFLYFQPVLGKLQRRPAVLDKTLAEELKLLRKPDDPFTLTVGKTMCTYDFYEGKTFYHFYIL